ncbi:TIGR03943 family protein [Bacillus salacetis]|uniref:TIGR03943 family protein n=1 Tax=Bacillus salacetis TaxID=2315464 RepID=A0A3A1R6S4_9BACI|nr:TIGR03943 family protein [Bacillus salacetis]RIW38928.1 TIGR03943 family protein [Bacillus salacetis]
MRTLQFHTYLRGIILIGYALLLLKLFLTFDMANFVAEKMHGYMYFALGVFIFLGAIQIIRGTSSSNKVHSCGCDAHELPRGFLKTVSVYSLFIIPVILGFMLPDNLLDSSVASKRGVNIGSGMYSAPPSTGEKVPAADEKETSKEESAVEATLGNYEEFPLEEDFDKLKVLASEREKVYVRDEQFIQTLSLIDENLDAFIGKEIQLKGFIYKDESFEGDQAVISRFTVTCCVADAGVYGLLAEDEQLGSLEPDTWVNVSGMVDKIDLNGYMMPFIKDPVYEVIDAPENPYVEEFFIKVE